MKSEPRDPATDNIAVLPVPRAASKVELLGTSGVFYSIHQGGELLKKRRGAWTIALKNGKTASLRSAGWMPGFQKLYLDGELIYEFGADAPLAAKIVSFLPIGLIAIHPFIGGVIGIVLVFLNLVTIKNPVFPNRVKIILPILNVVAGALVTIVILGGTTPSP